MTKGAQPDRVHEGISRRNFVRAGGAALAGGAAVGVTPTGAVAANAPAVLFPSSPDRTARIQQHRTLGRTGWEVSDIAMGTNRLRESAVVRYALDKGVNIITDFTAYDEDVKKQDAKLEATLRKNHGSFEDWIDSLAAQDTSE